jgi:hypothetical protein
MFIQVSPGRSPSGPYTLTLDEVPGDLSPFAAQAAPLALGTTVQGRNDFAYDTDAYAVTLAAGQRYAITVTEDATGTTNQIRLNDASGNPVLGEFLSTPGSRTLLVTAAASGMHDLRVQGWDGVGPYTLRVDPSADLPAGIDTPAVIAIGQTVDETFEHPGDRDWFAVDLVAGASYAFTLEQAGSFLRLLDAAGRPVQSTGTGDLTMPVTVEQAGRYFIEAATGALNAGPYRLTAAATDETPANPTTPAVLAAGETLTGALTALDADWFAVALAPDTTYRVTATRPAGAETVLSVHDAAGRTRAEQRGDDGAPLVFSTGTAGARFRRSPMSARPRRAPCRSHPARRGRATCSAATGTCSRSMPGRATIPSRSRPPGPACGPACSRSAALRRSGTSISARRRTGSRSPWPRARPRYSCWWRIRSGRRRCARSTRSPSRTRRWAPPATTA